MRESQFIDWIVLAEANVKLRSLRKLMQVVEVGDFGSLDHTRLNIVAGDLDKRIRIGKRRGLRRRIRREGGKERRGKK